MIGKITNIFKVKDLRKKIFFTFSMLIVFRLGGQVPIPGLGHVRGEFAKALSNFHTVRQYENRVNL